MVFKTFRFKIIVRVILLFAVIVAFAYFFQRPHYYFTSIELFLVAVLLVVELVYFVEKGYRQLNNMLQSVKEKDFNLSFSPVEKGKVFSNLAELLNDLTESYRKVRIEKEVHYQFLNHIIDQVSQVMICFDDEGIVSLSNRSAKNLLLLNNIKHISTFEKIDKDLPARLLGMKAGQELLFSFLYQGELKKYAAYCSSIKLLNKNYRLVVLHDIKAPLEEHEQDSYRKLIRVLTHEIMNSVTPILSLSQAMNETLKTDENTFRSIGELSSQEGLDIAEGYQAIEARSKALMRFVNDFKSLTRLPNPKIAAINAEEMFRDILTLLKPGLQEKYIEISVHYDLTVKFFNADKELIEQVIINLIKNAAEAVAQVKKGRIKIDLTKTNSRVIITVSDNGLGIPFGNFDKIFVPFFSTKKEGSGIGLSLSREIVRLHGGNITFRSMEGQGSEFIISLPQ